MPAIESEQVLSRLSGQQGTIRLSAVIRNQSHTYIAPPIKLLGEEGSEGIWVHLPEAAPDAVAELGKLLPACKGTCCIDKQRYTFETAVLRRDRHFWLNDSIMLDALLLQGPTDFQARQERRSERMLISDGCGISGRLFRVVEPVSPAGKRELVAITGKLRDLSQHSACFVCPFTRDLAPLGVGDALVCAIQFRQKETAFPARLANIRNISNRTTRIGFELRVDQNDPKATEIREMIKELERQRSLRQLRPAG